MLHVTPESDNHADALAHTHWLRNNRESATPQPPAGDPTPTPTHSGDQRLTTGSDDAASPSSMSEVNCHGSAASPTAGEHQCASASPTRARTARGTSHRQGVGCAGLGVCACTATHVQCVDPAPARGPHRGPRDRRATTGHGQDSAAHTRPGHGARRPRPHGSRTTHRTQNSRRLRLPGTSVPRTARTLNTPFTTGASRCGRVHIAARRGKTETTPHTRHTLFYRKPATWSCTRHQQLRHSGYHAGAPMARHDQAAWGQH